MTQKGGTGKLGFFMIRLNCVHVLIFGIKEIQGWLLISKYGTQIIDLGYTINLVQRFRIGERLRGDKFKYEFCLYFDIWYQKNSKLTLWYPYVNPTLILMFKNSAMFLVQYSIGKVKIEKSRRYSPRGNELHLLSKWMIMIGIEKTHVLNS